MKPINLIPAFGLVALGASFASAKPPAGAGFAGTFVASLPERAEILHLHADGTAGITLSDQVTAGAGGFTFSDSMGSWKHAGGKQISARFMNLNFDVTGPFATFSGIAVVDYTLDFANDHQTFAASCAGKIFPTGQDPLDPSSTLLRFEPSGMTRVFRLHVPCRATGGAVAASRIAVASTR